MIICYANTINYDHPLQQRPHHLMNLLAERGHTIHWVNQTKLDYKYRTKINENITVYHDWDKYVKNNSNKIDIYFASWSHRWVDIDKLKPKFTIYDSLDLFPANESEEKNMVKCADIILATTKNIMEYQKEHTNKEIYLCENGCFPKYRDTSLNVPDEFRMINKPIVLFSGALATNPIDGWVDYELIKRVAIDNHLVIVGMPWNMLETQKQELSKMNVTFVGSKDYDTLQKYYAHCTVNILPFRRCQTSDYSFPLKLVEGCNLGKICVATDIPVAVEFEKEFPLAVKTSDTRNGFLNNIKDAMNKNNDSDVISQCKELADKHSWDKKVDIIESAITNYCKNNNIILEV